MQLADLDMAEIEIHDPDFVNDPHAIYSAARKKNWLARFPMGYVLLDQQAMRDFLMDDRCRTPIRDISNMVGVEKGTPFERFYDHFFLALDGEAHKRLRRILAPAFTATFGQGIHFCIGMFMARALLEEALSVLVERMKNPELAGAAVFRHFSGMVGMEALPISFEPA